MFDTKEIQKVKKKINFPRFASAHPERTGLEGKTSNAQQRNTMTDTKSLWEKNFTEHFQKKIFLVFVCLRWNYSQYRRKY